MKLRKAVPLDNKRGKRVSKVGKVQVVFVSLQHCYERHKIEEEKAFLNIIFDPHNVMSSRWLLQKMSFRNNSNTYKCPDFGFQTSRDRKMLPRVHLISCQAVKMFIQKKN